MHRLLVLGPQLKIVRQVAKAGNKTTYRSIFLLIGSSLNDSRYTA